MKNLDDQLRAALGRETPPAGFAERVLERVNQEPGPAEAGRYIQGPAKAGHDVPIFVRWAAAAALVAAIAGVFGYRTIRNERDERARGEAAKEQVVQALQIVSSKLQLVQSKVKGVGS